MLNYSAQRLYNGEMQCKNPAGLPPRHPERIIPRDQTQEQEWWLRSNDRSREQTDPPFTYYSENSMKRNNFQAGVIGKDHSRRVFKELARQGHSFSEANLHALRQDRDLRKDMQKKYWEVMCTASKAPGPANKAMLRSQSQPAIASDSAPSAAAFDVASALSASAPQARGLGSVVSMAPSASLVAASRISGAAPTASLVAASRLSGASLSRVGGSVVGSGVGMDNPAVEAALAAQSNLEGGTVSQLSKSDFYAWRPRLLR